MSALPPEAPPLPDAPYRGIYSFRFIDQKIFAAREAETWALLRSILIYRGVLFYGDSGSGKSSLINAGLIAAASKENLIAHRLRIQPRRGSEIKIERIPIETDGQPPYLPSIFFEEGSAEDKDLNREISLEHFNECLAKLKDKPPADATSSDDTPTEEPRPLLIFDQFEEFVTLFEEVLRGGETDEAKRAQQAAPEVRKSILASLTRLMADQRLPVKILFVFREEYLAKLNLLFKSSPELLAQYVRLLPPRVGEAERIIRTPFADEELKNKFTRDAPSGSGKEIPEALAKEIAAQLQQRSESGFLNLSELQIICRRLWKTPDPVKFFQEKDADIQKVLEDYWAGVLKELGDLYDPAIALLGHMVTSSNTRNIISEPDLRFHEKGNFTPEQITQALKALVNSRLVRSETRYGTDIYEIASEFLVPWIQEKKGERLAQIEASKLAAETEQKLKQAERKRRNLAIGATVLGSLLIAAIGLAAYSIRLKRSADAAKETVKTQKEESDYLNGLLDDLTSAKEPERLAAVKGLADLDRKAKLPRAVVRLIVAVTLNESNKEVSEAASYFYTSLKAEEEINPDSSNFANSILKTAEEKNADLTSIQTSNKLPPRIYIQIASDNQRGRADKIAETLRREGFTVPAYQLVGGRAPTRNQLRYYKSPDTAEESANVAVLNKALQKISEADGQKWASFQLNRSSSVRAGHFEMWFASDPTTTTLLPSPTPITVTRVTVNLIFQDEQGNPITGSPLVSLEDVPYSKTFFVEQLKTFSAAPGNYLLFVQLRGYELYREKISFRDQPQINRVVRLQPIKEPARQQLQRVQD